VKKTFSSIFQNTKPCEYFNVNSIPSYHHDKLFFLIHLNMRSLQKTTINYRYVYFYTSYPGSLILLL